MFKSMGSRFFSQEANRLVFKGVENSNFYGINDYLGLVVYKPIEERKSVTEAAEES